MNKKALLQKMSSLPPVLKSPLFVTITGALLTALLAPFVIEHTRSKILRSDRIVTTQYEIVENLTELSFTYLVAARFLSKDMTEGQPNTELLSSHLQEYDRIAAKTLPGYSVQAYRARIYFGAPDLYESLQKTAAQIGFIDAEIVRQLTAQNNSPDTQDETTIQKWNWISDLLYNVQLQMERDMERLYQRVGDTSFTKSDASNIGKGEERPTR